MSIIPEPEYSSLIVHTVDPDNTEIEILPLAICTINNFNDAYFFENYSENNSLDIYLNEEIKSYLESNLNSKGYGFYIEVIPNRIDSKYASFTPTSNSNIWNIFFLNESVRNKDFLKKDKSMLNSNVSYQRIFTKKEFFEFKDMFINKTFDEITSELIKDGDENTDSNFDFEIADIIYDEDGTGLQNRKINLKPGSNSGSVSNAIHANESILCKDKSLIKVDPMKFLGDQYFSVLYNSSNSILSDFAKNIIPKMNSLCHANKTLSIDCLSHFIVQSIFQFDQRYSVNPTYDDELTIESFKEIWTKNELILDPSEVLFKVKFLDSFDISDTTSLSKIVYFNDALIDLKVKDSKLQILMSLELLKLLNRIESSNSSVNNLDSKLKSDSDLKMKPRLESKPKPKYVRSKLIGRKKRLIPTFVGTVVPENTKFDTDFRNPENVEKTFSAKSLINIIKALFDKLCVWDAVLEVPSKDNRSSFGFLLNCVIPLYEKIHHKLLKELVKRARGPTNSSRKILEKKKKEKLNVKKIVRKPTKIDLSNIKLKRTQSSFSTSKVDMSKRTFDMVKSTSFANFSQSENIQVNDESTFLQPVSVIDGSNLPKRKRKLRPAKENGKNFKPITQIEATPKKKRIIPKTFGEFLEPNQTIQATPISNSRRPLKKKFTIESSPIMNGSPLGFKIPKKSSVIEPTSPFKEDDLIKVNPFDEPTKFFEATPLKTRRKEHKVMSSSAILSSPFKPEGGLLRPPLLNSSPESSKINYDVPPDSMSYNSIGNGDASKCPIKLVEATPFRVQRKVNSKIVIDSSPLNNSIKSNRIRSSPDRVSPKKMIIQAENMANIGEVLKSSPVKKMSEILANSHKEILDKAKTNDHNETILQGEELIPIVHKKNTLKYTKRRLDFE